MKLIDERGRIFGKINILDLIFILALVLIIFVSVTKIFNRNVLEMVGSQEYKRVEVEAVIFEESGYLDVIKEGDTLGETREYLDGEILSVEIEPVEVLNLDENGNEVISIDPTREKANVVFTAQVLYQDSTYKLGEQELREGKSIFLESDLYKLSTQVVNMEVIDSYEH